MHAFIHSFIDSCCNAAMLHCSACRTLTERLLGARLIYKQPNMSRLISFEYLNRQLVWQELSEFLLFLLPLINVAKVKRFILKLLPRVP
jgi:peroxin-2